jgi:CHAT domain-containing protein
VLESSVVEIRDSNTKRSLNLNLALAQASNVPIDGFLAVGLAELAEQAGSSGQAERLIDAAVISVRGTPDPRVRAEIEGGIEAESGNLRRDLGEYAEAIDFYGQAVEKYRSVQDLKSTSGALAKIAELYRQIGDYSASAQWYGYSLQESEQAGDVDSQMTALLRLTQLAAQMEDRSALAKYQDEVERLGKKALGDRSKAADLITGEFPLALGEILAEYGDPSQAIEWLEPFVAYYRRLPQSTQALRKLAFALGFLAEAYTRASHYQSALGAFSQAAAIAEANKFPEVMRIYSRMAYVYEKQGDLVGALKYDRLAADALERFAAAQELPQLRLSSQELAWGPYENLTRVTYELYQKTHSVDLLNQALIYHEQARTRALRDLLNEAGIRARTPADHDLALQEERLQGKISALQSAFSSVTVSDLRKVSLEQALSQQTGELARLHDKIVATNAKYQSIEASSLVKLPEVQGLLSDDAVLLDYDLGPDISGVGVITKSQVNVYQLPPEEVVAKRIDQFLPTIQEPLFQSDEIRGHVQLARQLYATLLGSARNQIKGKHHIIVVPDGQLFYLPFEGLIADDEKLDGPADSLSSQPYLGKIYSFSYAPSASVLVTLKRLHANLDNAPRPLLAFGDPAFQSSSVSQEIALSTRGAYEKMGIGFDRLPYSAEEVRAVMRAYAADSGSIYLGTNATKKVLLALDLSQYRILHFATHAVIGDEVKWISQPALIFSPDGSGTLDNDVLKMSEIFDLRLNADLVVLSACETARGNMSRGEGIIGLTSAFLFAGGRSVVASLWNVNDESTSLFMESFYEGLKAGLPKAEALQQARVKTMQKRIKRGVTGEQESLASPYFWAPFVLIGEW